MKNLNLFLIFFILISSIYASGCSSQEPGEKVNGTVVAFLEAVNAGNFNLAYDMYEGKDFLVPASIDLTFKNKHFSPGGLKEVVITSEEHNDVVAVVTAHCTVARLDENGNELERKVLPVYFKLQYTELGWIITRVSFSTPFELSQDDLVTIEIEATPIDPIVENSVPITIFSVLLFSTGIYLNRKEKQNKNIRTVDTSNAAVMPKESLVQFIRIIPSQQIVVGRKAIIDVWVKNFSPQPYDNFTVTAKFPNTVEIKDAVLFFGSVPPGQTMKQSWTFVPKIQGWVGIEQPIIVFEYLGAKYAGTLDTVWIPVQ